MPYSPDDPNLPDYVKSLSAKRKRQWTDIFNSSYSRCMKGKSGDDAGKQCESSAFAQANGVVKVGKANNAATFSAEPIATFELPAQPGPIYSDDEMVYRAGLLFRAGEYPDKAYAMTPDELKAAVEDFSGPVALDLEHVPSVLDGKIGELVSVECSDDGDELHGIVALPKWLDAILDERKVSATWDRATKRLAGLALVRNPRVSDAALMAAFNNATMTAPTKTEDGKAFQKGDYAYAPGDKPSEWKLRLTNTPGGDPDPGIVGAAIAALGKGFRGQKVDIPDSALAGVKRKVRAAWKKANPDKSDDDMPDAIKMSQDDALAESLEALFAAARHDTPQGQSVLQGIHDTAARGGAVCKSTNAVKMASSHEASAIQKVHDLAADHGAKCAAMTQRDGPVFPFFNRGASQGGRRMSRLEEFVAWLKGDEGEGGGSGATAPPPMTTAASAATMSDKDKAELSELQERNRQLQAENRRIRAEATYREAIAFADKQIADRKAFPAERDSIIAQFVQAATDDQSYGTVTFGEGDKQVTKTRVDLLKEQFTARPGHQLTIEQLKPELVSLLENHQQTPGTGDKPPTPDEVKELLAKTSGGRATIAFNQKNGRN
jgi:hypothetical protein